MDHRPEWLVEFQSLPRFLVSKLLRRRPQFHNQRRQSLLIWQAFGCKASGSCWQGCGVPEVERDRGCVRCHGNSQKAPGEELFLSLYDAEIILYCSQQEIIAPVMRMGAYAACFFLQPVLWKMPRNLDYNTPPLTDSMKRSPYWSTLYGAYAHGEGVKCWNIMPV